MNKWSKWFAWHPVNTPLGWRWFCNVHRRKTYCRILALEGNYHWEYSAGDPAVAAAQFLFRLLDDIDTVSDIVKADDRSYRELVERIQRRRFEVGAVGGSYKQKLEFRFHEGATYAASDRAET